MNDKNNFLQLLNPDNTMSFNRLLAHAIGATETIIYFSLVSKMTYYDSKGMLDEGFFYATAIDIQESTTFTQRQQVPAVRKLVALGLIETKIKGVPAKKYYKIINDTDLILNLIECGKNIASSLKKHPESQETSQVEQNVDPCIDKMSNLASTKCQTLHRQNVDEI